MPEPAPKPKKARKPKVDCDANPCYKGCPDHGNTKRCPDTLTTEDDSTPSLTVTDVTNILKRHNKARQMHQLPLIQWDLSLSGGAQEFAHDCNFKHSSNDFRATEYSKLSGNLHTNAATARVGESVIADADTDDAVNVDAFFAHAVQWHCDTDKCEPTDGAKPACGSLRQVLYENLTKVGCGYKVCQVNSPFGADVPKWNFLVCWYYPALPHKTRPFPADQCDTPADAN